MGFKIEYKGTVTYKNAKVASAWNSLDAYRLKDFLEFCVVSKLISAYINALGQATSLCTDFPSEERLYLDYEFKVEVLTGIEFENAMRLSKLNISDFFNTCVSNKSVVKAFIESGVLSKRDRLDLTKENAARIKELRENGYTDEEITNKLGFSTSFIREIGLYNDLGKSMPTVLDSCIMAELYIGTDKQEILNKLNCSPTDIKRCIMLIKENDRLRVYELYENGLSPEEIAATLDISLLDVLNYGYKHKVIRHGEQRAIKTDYSKLNELYMQGLKDMEIADKCDCSLNTVRRFRMSNNLPPNIPINTNYNKINALYLQGLNDTEIATKCYCSPYTVKKFRAENNLPTNRPSAIDYNKINELYMKGLSDIEMAVKGGCALGTIRRFREENNLPVNRSTTIDYVKVKELYMQGLIDTEIAAKCDCSVNSVRIFRRENNLQANKRATSM